MITIICVTYVQKNFKFELQLSSCWKNIKFSRYCPKFHIFTKIVIFKYICHFLDQLLHPYKFYGRDLWQDSLFHFCQLWAVNIPKLKIYTAQNEFLITVINIPNHAIYTKSYGLISLDQYLYFTELRFLHYSWDWRQNFTKQMYNVVPHKQTKPSAKNFFISGEKKKRRWLKKKKKKKKKELTELA